MLFYFFFSITHSYAQFFTTGNEPLSTKWKQINTVHYQLIYPDFYEEEAQILANKLDYTYAFVAKSLNHSPKKISIIFHAQTAYSNGMVPWAPKRVELYTTPEQDISPNSWMEHLITHELRHVVQVDKMNTSINGIMSSIFGQAATVIPVALFMPPWFLEGDAVCTETALTKGGRGRMPNFEQGVKALILEDTIPNYSKMFLGSYKNYIPNHYESGYLVTAWNRIYRSDSIFKVKTDAMAKASFNLFSNSARGLKDRKKSMEDKYYEPAIRDLKIKWQQQVALSNAFSGEQIIPKSNKYANYTHLVKTKKGAYAIKETLNSINQIVFVDKDGKEEKLMNLSLYADNWFSGNENYLYWSELRYHPRWEHVAWSEIWTMDVKTKKKRRLTSKTRCFAPTISPNGNDLATVNTSKTDEYTIEIMDATLGTIKQTILPPNNAYPMHPTWNATGTSIAYVTSTSQGNGLYTYNFKDNTHKCLIPASSVNLKNPSFTAHGIVFTAAYNGVDNIYYLNQNTNTVTQVSNELFGANFGYLENDTLLYASYTSKGYKPTQITSEQFSNRPVNKVKDYSVKMHKALAKMEGGAIDYSKMDTFNWQSKPYYPGLNLFQFHTFLPFNLDLDNQQLYPGLSVHSQNKLNSSMLSAGVDFQPQNADEKYFVKYEYYGFWPKLSASYFYGEGTSTRFDEDKKTYQFKRSLHTLRASIDIPFKFNKHTYYGAFNPFILADAQWYNFEPFDSNPTALNLESLTIPVFEGGLQFYNFQHQASRDKLPKWGQYFQLGYRSTINSTLDMGSLNYFASRFYFPGLAPQHNLLLSLNGQAKQFGEAVGNSNYSLSNRIAFPRGVQTINSNYLVSAFTDYRFPIAFTEWELSYYLYIKRLNGGVFYDQAYSKLEQDDTWNHFHSTGAQFSMDFHILRYEPEITLGYQQYLNLNDYSLGGNLIFAISFPF